MIRRKPGGSLPAEWCHHNEPAAEGGFAVQDSDGQWSAITAGLRRGDSRAEADFIQRYGGGVRAFFLHHLGPIGMDALVDEAVAGVLNEIRRGWIRSPRDLIHFLRAVAERQQRGMEKQGIAPGSALSRARVIETSNRIAAALDRFAPSDRRLLEQYYVEGKPLDAVAAQAGLDVAELVELTTRLKRAIKREEAREEAREHAVVPPQPLVRKAGAGD